MFLILLCTFANLWAETKEIKNIEDTKLLNSMMLSKKEFKLLNALHKRNKELDDKAANIAIKEQKLKLILKEVQNKIDALNEMENWLKKQLKEHDQKVQEQTLNWVKSFANMKPKDAAKILDKFPMVKLKMIVENLNPKVFAKIMPNMDVAKITMLNQIMTQ